MAGASCREDHEICCPRSDEIECLRCTDITYQVAGLAVQTDTVQHNLLSLLTLGAT